MKKIIIIAFLFLSIHHFSFGQGEGEIRAQYAVEYGFGSNLFGNMIGVEYFPMDNFSVLPAFTIFYPATGKASAFNLDARYYLLDDDHQAYGIFGYNAHRRRLEFAPVEENLINRSGLNLGAGYGFKVAEEFILNTEMRYQPHNRDVMWRIGLFYLIN
jgi:hypothetical protein